MIDLALAYGHYNLRVLRAEISGLYFGRWKVRGAGESYGICGVSMEVLQSKQELEAWAMLQRLSVICVGLQGWQAWW